MTTRRLEVRKETYRDSITMLKISNQLAKLEGVRQAAAVMATPLNKKILRDIGFEGETVDSVKSDDMIIAIDAVTEERLEQAFAKANELLSAKPLATSSGKPLPRSLDAALEQMQDANMIVISVPGKFAKREAINAINKGLNIFLFSSNVTTEDERELKEKALSHDLLLMGPDCGTSIINNVVLGFGNVLHPGPIGIVSAAGTGLQQVSTLIDREGVGISQGIGTGGNDLSDEVGGLTMIQGMKLLNNDSQTKVIVLVSKPPGKKTAERVLQEASRCSKPVVVNFLGMENLELGNQKNCVQARTLEEAANLALKSVGKSSSAENDTAIVELKEVIMRETEHLTPRQKSVKGLYSGGTLCYEAQVVMKPILGEIRSNTPLDNSMRVADDSKVRGLNVCIDMGAEEFVAGRVHPMIDYTLRKMRILKEAQDPETAVILLDVLLGYGSNVDPAAELVPAISEAKRIAADDGRYISIMACVVGTKEDPQRIDYQEKRLAEAEVILFPSNAKAAYAAAQVATRRTQKD